LTWENLRLFHSRHYSPQNACFFTYGNLPVEPHLEFVKNYLPGQKETAAYQGKNFDRPVPMS
jgi:Zn-dependent M16 (insulinase) family peptidase